MAAARINLPDKFCFLLVGLLIPALTANAVSLPFFEAFNTPTNDAVSTYTDLTYGDGGSGFNPSYVVKTDGILQVGSGDYPYYQAFGVTPDPFPTGELIIKLDMGWDGSINDPPVGVGFGGCGMRLGTKIEVGGATGSLNNIGFHPGYPGGALRVEGPGGFSGANMGWTPQPGVLNHMEIDSFPDGTFNVQVVDGTNPANVYTTSFVSPGAYGGEVAILAWAGGTGLYDNFSIRIAGAPLLGDYDNDGFVGAADYVVWRKNVGQPAGSLPNDNTGLPIGAEQYNLWRSNFGAPAAGSGSLTSSTVPEAPAIVLLLIGIVSPSITSRRRSACRTRLIAPNLRGRPGGN
jgi:hypothetical protein